MSHVDSTPHHAQAPISHKGCIEGMILKSRGISSVKKTEVFAVICPEHGTQGYGDAPTAQTLADDHMTSWHS